MRKIPLRAQNSAQWKTGSNARMLLDLLFLIYFKNSHKAEAAVSTV
jgi:hypothetical protein